MLKFYKVFKRNKQNEDKTKSKENCAKSNLVCNKDFILYKYHNTKQFAAKRSFDSKQNDLSKFKKILELFNHDTIKIKPDNEDQIKDLKKRKVVIATGFELYDNFLNIYTAQYDKLTKAQKKRIKVQNRTESLAIDLNLDEAEDGLPPMPPL